MKQLLKCMYKSTKFNYFLQFKYIDTKKNVTKKKITKKNIHETNKNKACLPQRQAPQKLTY